VTRNSTWFVDEVCHSDGAAKLTMSRVWATPAGDTKKRSSSILLLLVLCTCLSCSSAQRTSDAVQWQVCAFAASVCDSSLCIVCTFVHAYIWVYLLACHPLISALLFFHSALGLKRSVRPADPWSWSPMAVENRMQSFRSVACTTLYFMHSH